MSRVSMLSLGRLLLESPARCHTCCDTEPRGLQSHKIIPQTKDALSLMLWEKGPRRIRQWQYDLHSSSRGRGSSVSGFCRNVRQPFLLLCTGTRTTRPKTWGERQGTHYLLASGEILCEDWAARKTMTVWSVSCLCPKWCFPDKSVQFRQASAQCTQLFSTTFNLFYRSECKTKKYFQL